ncbi:hypothetical protein I4U23_016089 [Adineta vaga]|nr:hypothetical protein I4U23_016089 [Adineta vaga]
MFARMSSFYALILVIFTTVVFQCNSAPIVYTITQQQYTTIQIGWTRDQVTKLIGTGGNVISEAGIGSTAATLVQYTGPQPTISVVIFTFQNGILFGKAQSGLYAVNYTMTLQQYTALQIGWTRDQVTSLVGSSGIVTSEAGTGVAAALIVQYKTAGTSYGIVNVVFSGGKLISKSEIGSAPTVNNKITLQQYNTIQIGWTRQQVTQLLGGNGTTLSQTGSQGSPIQFTMVQYTGSQSTISVVIFTFQNGILFGKAQSGLDTGIYTMTSQQYTALQIGWTRDQVTSFVGSSGSAASEAGTGITANILVRYTAPGTTYGIADLNFVGGKLFSKTAIGFFLIVSNKITLQQYNTIQIGWTRQQVTQLLGGNGNILSQSGTEGSPYQFTMVQYTGSQSSTSIAIFNFLGGLLFSKAHSGLDTGNYTMTLQQYTALQIGWTRDQVTSLVGSSGSAISEAGTGFAAALMVQYKTAGTSYGIVNVVFSGGKLLSKTAIGFK